MNWWLVQHMDGGDNEARQLLVRKGLGEIMHLIPMMVTKVCTFCTSPVLVSTNISGLSIPQSMHTRAP